MEAPHYPRQGRHTCFVPNVSKGTSYCTLITRGPCICHAFHKYRYVICYSVFLDSRYHGKYNVGAIFLQFKLICEFLIVNYQNWATLGCADSELNQDRRSSTKLETLFYHLCAISFTYCDRYSRHAATPGRHCKWCIVSSRTPPGACYLFADGELDLIYESGGSAGHYNLGAEYTRKFSSSLRGFPTPNMSSFSKYITHSWSWPVCAALCTSSLPSHNAGVLFLQCTEQSLRALGCGWPLVVQ